MSAELVGQLGNERTARHVPAAAANPTLAAQAQTYADQVAAGTQPPTDPSYQWLSANTGSPPVYAIVFAAGGSGATTGSITDVLMGSAGHQPSMMEPSYNLVGAGAGVGCSAKWPGLHGGVLRGLLRPDRLAASILAVPGGHPGHGWDFVYRKLVPSNDSTPDNTTSSSAHGPGGCLLSSARW